VAPLEIKKTAVTTEALQAGIRISNKVRVPRNKETHWSSPFMLYFMGELVLQNDDGLGSSCTEVYHMELRPAS